MTAVKPLGQVDSATTEADAIYFMRVVAIALIVFGHAQRGLAETGMASGTYWSSIYPVVDYAIYEFHVPIFFLTSGLLLEQRNGESLSRLLFRLRRLLLLYLIWNFINAVPAYVFSDLTNRNFGNAGLIDAFNPFHINGIMWFFVALAFAYVAHFLTFRRRVLRWIAILVAVVVLARDVDFAGAAYGTLWLLLGAEVARTFTDRDIDNRGLFMVAAAAVYAAATFCFYGLNVPYTLAIPAGAAAILFFYCAGRVNSLGPTILFMGKNTLSIYVMHVIIVAGLRILLVRILHLDPSAGLIVVLTIGGIFAPLLLLLGLRYAGLSRLLLLE